MFGFCECDVFVFLVWRFKLGLDVFISGYRVNVGHLFWVGSKSVSCVHIDFVGLSRVWFQSRVNIRSSGLF